MNNIWNCLFANQMTVHAWENYKKYAWGKNELRPLSKIGNAGVFGSNDLGATIVDSLDTLYIMGLKEQYLEGRQWVADKFTLENKVRFRIFWKGCIEIAQFSSHSIPIWKFLFDQNLIFNRGLNESLNKSLNERVSCNYRIIKF